MRRGQKPITVYLPIQLYEWLRRTAFLERTPMVKIIREALGHELSRRGKRKAKR